MSDFRHYRRAAGGAKAAVCRSAVLAVGDSPVGGNGKGYRDAGVGLQLETVRV